MYVPKRLLLPVLVVALAASSLVFALGASADRGNREGASADILDSSLAPSLPSPTDPTIHGVKPGGAPWGLTEGSVRLRDDGRVEIRIDGLVLPTVGTGTTPGPVSEIAASLFCGADSNTTTAATTAAVPLSSDGDAVIRTTVTLPSTCLAPIVLVNPGTTASGLSTSTYIAITGFMH
jgi:hypothetical protein